MSDFGELRSITHGEASQEAFDALIALFETHDGAQDELERVWLPYALERVRSWPARERRVRLVDPKRFGDTPPSWLALVGELEFGRGTDDPALVRELLLSSRCSGLERLSFFVHKHTEGFVGWLTESEHLGALAHLDLGNPATPAELRGLADARTLRLTSFAAYGVDDDAAVALAHSPVLAGVDRLRMNGSISERGARALASSEFFARVRHLDLGYNAFMSASATALLSRRGVPFETLKLSENPLGPDAIPALVASGRLEGVVSLHLDDCELRDADAVSLAGSGHLGALRALELQRNRIADAGAIALASADLGALTELHLDDNRIGAAGVIALVRGPSLGALSTLDLDENDCSQDTFEPPPDRSQPGSLSELFLSGTALGPRLFSEVLASRSSSSLTALYCHGGRIGTEGARALRERVRPMTALEDLVLDASSPETERNPIGDEGLEALMAPGARAHFPSLTQLDLGSNAISDASAHVLPGSGLDGLVVLVLDANPLSDAWIQALAGSPVIHALEELNLDATAVTDAGLGFIARSPGFAKLETIGLSHVPATDLGLRALLTSPELTSLKTLETTIDVHDETMRALAQCPHRAAFERLSVGRADLSAQTWRALATSAHLRALNDLAFASELEPLLEALDALRREGAELNAWTGEYTR